MTTTGDWLSCCRLLSYCVLPTCYLPPPPAASPAGYLAADCSRTVCCLPANCRLPPPPAASPAGYLAADCSPTLYCLPSMLFTIANASPVSGRQAMVAELAASGRRLFVFAFLPLSLLLLRPAPSRQWPFPRRCRIGDAKMPDPRPRSFMPRRHMYICLMNSQDVWMGGGLQNSPHGWYAAAASGRLGTAARGRPSIATAGHSGPEWPTLRFPF